MNVRVTGESSLLPLTYSNITQISADDESLEITFSYDGDQTLDRIPKSRIEDFEVTLEDKDDETTAEGDRE